jgi:phospholipid/cholesterol/gamma-HCH transport system permease protein
MRSIIVGEAAAVEDTQSRIAFETRSGAAWAVVLGDWSAAHLAPPAHWAAVQTALTHATALGPVLGWDLRLLQRLDHSGAQLLWNAWGRHWPTALELLPAQRAMLERVAHFSSPSPARPRVTPWGLFEQLGAWVMSISGHFLGLVRLVG